MTEPVAPPPAPDAPPRPEPPPARRRFVLARLATAVRRQDWFTVLVEIAVVVLGVVIGFQVNAWGQDRANAAEERALLVGLRTDMETNLTRIDRFEVHNENAIEHARALIALTGPSPPAVDPATVDSLLVTALEFELYVPADGRLDALLASGRIGLVQSDSLQGALASWKSIVQAMRGDERRLGDQVYEHVLPYLRDRVPLLSMDSSTGFLDTPPSRFPRDYGVLLADVRFENLVEERWVNGHFLLVTLGTLREATVEILRLIDARLAE